MEPADLFPCYLDMIVSTGSFYLTSLPFGQQEIREDLPRGGRGSHMHGESPLVGLVLWDISPLQSN